MQLLHLVATVLLGTASASRQRVLQTENATSTCKCFPGDLCWPSQDDWSVLNSTLQGRLIATVPLGSPCHDPTYDEEECALLQAQWLYAGIQ